MENIRQFSSCKLIILYNSLYIEFFVESHSSNRCFSLFFFSLFRFCVSLCLQNGRRWQNVPLHAECLRYSSRRRRLGCNTTVSCNSTATTVLQQQVMQQIATDSTFTTVHSNSDTFTVHVVHVVRCRW